MTAEQARELFGPACDDELDAAQREAFEAALEADAALGREYAAFREMLGLMQRTPAPAVPDLLPGVQRKLRLRSRGRFYPDRFAERRRRGGIRPIPLALFMLFVLALGWAALRVLQAVQVG